VPLEWLNMKPAAKPVPETAVDLTAQSEISPEFS
jgi:hypothetical protein